MIHTGRTLTKRTFERICFYLSGWASLEELQRRDREAARHGIKHHCRPPSPPPFAVARMSRKQNAETLPLDSIAPRLKRPRQENTCHNQQPAGSVPNSIGTQLFELPCNGRQCRYPDLSKCFSEIASASRRRDRNGRHSDNEYCS
jgi:hypothetical protein